MVHSGAGAPETPIVLRALLCERFNCLPSELADEPADELLAVAKVLSLRDQFVREKERAQAKTPKGTRIPLT